jgi:hypothetical protein
MFIAAGAAYARPMRPSARSLLLAIVAASCVPAPPPQRTGALVK